MGLLDGLPQGQAHVEGPGVLPNALLRGQRHVGLQERDVAPAPLGGFPRRAWLRLICGICVFLHGRSIHWCLSRNARDACGAGFQPAQDCWHALSAAGWKPAPQVLRSFRDGHSSYPRARRPPSALAAAPVRQDAPSLVLRIPATTSRSGFLRHPRGLAATGSPPLRDAPHAPVAHPVYWSWSGRPSHATRYTNVAVSCMLRTVCAIPPKHGVWQRSARWRCTCRGW